MGATEDMYLHRTLSRGTIESDPLRPGKEEACKPQQWLRTVLLFLFFFRVILYDVLSVAEDDARAVVYR